MREMREMRSLRVECWGEYQEGSGLEVGGMFCGREPLTSGMPIGTPSPFEGQPIMEGLNNIPWTQELELKTT